MCRFEFIVKLVPHLVCEEVSLVDIQSSHPSLVKAVPSANILRMFSCTLMEPFQQISVSG